MRHYRELNRLSQAQLGERCQSTGQYVSEIERGDSWPSPLFLEKIAQSLGVTMAKLFEPPPQERQPFDREAVVFDLSQRIKDELLETVDKIRADFLMEK